MPDISFHVVLIPIMSGRLVRRANGEQGRRSEFDVKSCEETRLHWLIRQARQVLQVSIQVYEFGKRAPQDDFLDSPKSRPMDTENPIMWPKVYPMQRANSSVV